MNSLANMLFPLVEMFPIIIVVEIELVGGIGSICTCFIPDSFQLDGSIRCLDYESDSDSDSDIDDMETIQRRRTRRLFRGLMDSLVTVVPKRNLLRSVLRDTMVLSRLRRRCQV